MATRRATQRPPGESARTSPLGTGSAGGDPSPIRASTRVPGTKASVGTVTRGSLNSRASRDRDINSGVSGSPSSDPSFFVGHVCCRRPSNAGMPPHSGRQARGRDRARLWRRHPSACACHELADLAFSAHFIRNLLEKLEPREAPDRSGPREMACFAGHFSIAGTGFKPATFGL
jgi:hypothetical protein